MRVIIIEAHTVLLTLLAIDISCTDNNRLFDSINNKLYNEVIDWTKEKSCIVVLSNSEESHEETTSQDETFRR